MTTQLPEGYRVQDGCWNCGFAFAYFEHDEPLRYFCMAGAPPRPSSLHDGGERPGPWDWSENGMREFARWAWFDWRQGRDCRAEGICPRYFKPSPGPTEAYVRVPGWGREES